MVDTLPNRQLPCRHYAGKNDSGQKGVQTKIAFNDLTGNLKEHERTVDRQVMSAPEHTHMTAMKTRLESKGDKICTGEAEPYIFPRDGR